MDLKSPWLSLFLAGCLEVVWALQMKKTEGFSKLGPGLITLGTMGISFYLLARALKDLPVGTAYAVWTGIGAIGTAIFGILFYKEPANLIRIFCIFLIALGIFGLKFFHKT